MGGSGFKDHFSGMAAGYAAFRPRYPAALAAWLASMAPARALAWDAGCGSGQLSVLLAQRFAEVRATDASAQQIAAAKPDPRIDYAAAPADRSGLASGSVDLVTAAQAAHWFDLPAFYAEVDRVARPGALVALIAYGALSLDIHLDPLILGFHRGTLGDWWPPERRLVEDGYRGVDFPFREIAPPGLAIETDWSLPELLGYVATWSAVKRLREAGGAAQLDRFAEALAERWGAPEAKRRVRFPLALRVGYR
jgi:SAM-dependent methyltransferase